MIQGEIIKIRMTGNRNLTQASITGVVEKGSSTIDLKGKVQRIRQGPKRSNLVTGMVYGALGECYQF